MAMETADPLGGLIFNHMLYYLSHDAEQNQKIISCVNHKSKKLYYFHYRSDHQSNSLNFHLLYTYKGKLYLKPMDSFGMWWKSNEIIFLHWIIIL